ncbi:MAG: ZPR1 zinc finger domain-containing protein [Candidatus Nanoarchaeia archaeon]
MEKLENQPCPICHKKTLSLTEDEMDIPYFGKTYLFSMNCSNCKYSKSDVEAEERKEPCKVTFMIEKEEDMKVRVVKSSEASVRIPQLKMSMESGPASDGFVSNIEGLLSRFEKVIEDERDLAEEDDVKKHAKNLLKKIRKVKWGEMPLKIIIEDPSGNSAIISDKAIVEKLKLKK